MSSDPLDLNPTPQPEDALEERLHSLAARCAYPPTPNLAAGERRRLEAQARRKAGLWRPRPAWALVILALLAALMLVSPVRASLLEWIRIGAVQIFLGGATPTPSASPTSIPPAAIAPATPALAFPQTATPPKTPGLEITPTPLHSVLDLGGETSLADASARAGFAIGLPAFPPDLGQPDHVYLQDFGSPVVVLVWMDMKDPSQVRMSLSEVSSDSPIFQKYATTSVLDTRVGGQPGVWIDGGYMLVTGSGEMTMTRLIVQSHTLIWTAGKLTYRLETDNDLQTAIQIGESIR